MSVEPIQSKKNDYTLNDNCTFNNEYYTYTHQFWIFLSIYQYVKPG